MKKVDFSKHTREDLIHFAEIKLKRIEELEKNIEVSEKRENKLELKIKELEFRETEFFESEQNKEKYGNMKQFQMMENRIKNLQELLEIKEREVKSLRDNRETLIKYAETNKINVDKATKIRIEKKEQRLKDYKQKIEELKQANPKITTSEIILELGISKKTFYNLNLDDFLQQK